jgi:hypothetical protein
MNDIRLTRNRYRATCVVGLASVAMIMLTANVRAASHLAPAHTTRTVAKHTSKKHRRTPCGHSPSYAKAYGEVIGNAIPVALSLIECINAQGKVEPLSHLYHVTKGSPRPGSPLGTYCFQPTRPEDLEGAVVVVSVTGPPWPSKGPVASRYATWMPEAMDCSQGELEIQTGEITLGSSGLIQTPSGYVDFSFVVP